jgi:hypothetical protein
MTEVKQASRDTAKIAVSTNKQLRVHSPAPSTTHIIQCFGPDGTFKWSETVPNLVTDEGLDDILDQYFTGTSYTASWYIGLIDGSGSPTLDAGDTAGEIGGTNGWDEFTSYSETERQEAQWGSVSSQSIDNSNNRATYSINASGSVHGAFLITDNTKDGTTGVLYAVAAFSSARNVEDEDTLNVTMIVSNSSA